MNIDFILEFYRDLDQNNNKAWFDTQRSRYEMVKKEINLFCVDFLKELTLLDPNYHSLLPKDCVYRINRDVRFSKNKSPYKNNTAIYAAIGGKKSNKAGFYFHLQPDNCFIAFGIYEFQPEDLAKVRQEIDYNFETFSKLLEEKYFKKHFGEISGEKLVNPPKGYDKDNPAIELIKHKSFIASSIIKSRDISVSLLIEKCKIGLPIVNFLNHAVS